MVNVYELYLKEKLGGYAMIIKNIAAIYSMIIGISMIGMWTILFITSSIPEISTEPIRIGMHIFAEATTGVILILGAFGLLRNKKWGFNMYLISMGLLLYTLLASPGYYAEKGDMMFVGMFLIILILTIIFVIISFVKKEEFKHNVKKNIKNRGRDLNPKIHVK